MKPLVIDVFCGDGGAARGYIAAGFDVIGIDLDPNHGKRYPGVFYAGDWQEELDYLRWSGERPTLVHLSPPCQRYSQGTVAGHSHKHPDLIGPVRDYMLDWGGPFVIENVERAPLIDPVTLCGTMFGLEVDDSASGRRLYLKRHRLFEAHGFELTAPGPCRCTEFDRAGLICGGVYGGARSDLREAREVRGGGYVPKSKATKAALLGVNPDDFTVKGMYECIPPAYSAWVGRSFLASRERAA